MDSSLFLRLLDEHRAGLILYARQWNPSDAEDVVQDAFLKLLRETPVPHAPKAWLFRVVRNLSFDRLRRKKQSNPLPENGTDDWFEPDDGQSRELTDALIRLPEYVREIIVSKIWGNLTFREIAELTGRPISSVHLDYQQGIARLRELLT